MTCTELNCRNLSCALCYDCHQSVCFQHLLSHHEIILVFYENLQDLYDKLHSMNIERCYNQVFKQIHLINIDLIIQLRSIREELIEQLIDFKQKYFQQLKDLSLKIANRKHDIQEIQSQLERIRTSIYSLVYGIHVEISKTVRLRKIFHHQTSSSSITSGSFLKKSSSWTNGLTDNYWVNKNDFDERLSLI